MFHRISLFSSMIVLTGAVGGCGPPRAGSNPETLIGAKFEIPVYPGARVISKRSMMFQKEGAGGEVTSFDTLTWELETSDPVERVVEYYTLRLPDVKAEIVPHDELGNESEPDSLSKRFEYTPSGAAEGDSVVITISEERLEVEQITRRE